MRFIKQLSAGICLSIGFIFLAVTVSVWLTPKPTENDRSAALGGLIIGVPFTAGGLWIIKGLRDEKGDRRHRLELQLELVFVQLLEEGKGRMTPAQFAIAAQLTLAESRQYLDRKAAELNADFEVSDEGAIVYRFRV